MTKKIFQKTIVEAIEMSPWSQLSSTLPIKIPLTKWFVNLYSIWGHHPAVGIIAELYAVFA